MILYGKHTVRAALLNRPNAIKRIVMREGAAKYLQEFIDYAEKIKIKPEYLHSGEFLRQGKLKEEEKHQGIFIVCDNLDVYSEAELPLLKNGSVILLLDKISNPNNFGTIIRTAAFFHVDAVIWLKNAAADLTAEVIRISVGGAEFVKLFRVTNLARTLDQLKDMGYWIYGMDEHGSKILAEANFADKTAFIIGSEGGGLRHHTEKQCDEMVRIPGGQTGLGSLNAAVATAIVLAEIKRNNEKSPCIIPP